MIRMDFQYFTADLNVVVIQEMMTNNTMVSTFRGSITNAALVTALPEANGGEHRWVWLTADFGKYGARGGRPFAEYGQNFALEITQAFVRPEADAILFLGSFCRDQDRYDLLMPFIQHGRKVIYRGDQLHDWEERPQLYGAHLKAMRTIAAVDTMVAAVFDMSTFAPPGVCAEYSVRVETVAQTDESPLSGFAQANIGMKGTEGDRPGSEFLFFHYPGAKGNVPAQFDMLSKAHNPLLVVPPGRDFIYFSGENDDGSTVTMMPGGHTLIDTPDPIAVGGSWVTLWQMPIGHYLDPANFVAEADGDAPWEFKENESVGWATQTMAQYIGDGEFRPIPGNADFPIMRLHLMAGGAEGANLAKMYIAEADEANRPSYLGSPVALAVGGDTSPSIGPRETVVTDQFTLARTGSKGLVFRSYQTDAANDSFAQNDEYDTDCEVYAAATDLAATTGNVAASFTLDSEKVVLVRRIEVLIE